MDQHPTPPPHNPAQLVAAMHHSSFSGPLPPPDVLKRYNEVVPGAAERIITMAEAQAKHRQELERAEVFGGNRRANLGQYFGFTIGIAGLVVALILGIRGNAWVAGLIGVLDLGGLVSIFVYGSRSRRSERREKGEAFAEAVQRTSRSGE